MKNIPVCDLFYRVALDTTGPLPKTKNGNRYALVAIDHYSMWCEARPIKDHDDAIVVIFLKKEIICKFGVPIFIFINNGGKWTAKVDLMRKKIWDYSLVHSSTMASMQWNGGENDQDLEEWIICGVIY
jgi:hypothetical protein